MHTVATLGVDGGEDFLGPDEIPSKGGSSIKRKNSTHRRSNSLGLQLTDGQLKRRPSMAELLGMEDFNDDDEVGEEDDDEGEEDEENRKSHGG